MVEIAFRTDQITRVIPIHPESYIPLTHKNKYLLKNLEKPIYLSGLGVNIDIQITWRGGQAGNSLNVGGQSIPANVSALTWSSQTTYERELTNTQLQPLIEHPSQGR